MLAETGPWLNRLGVAAARQRRAAGQHRVSRGRRVRRRHQAFGDTIGIVVRHPRGVVLGYQWHWIGADDLGDRPDVTASVEVTAAGGIVVAFDVPDDRRANASAFADLGDAEPGVAARFRERTADTHVSPLRVPVTSRPGPVIGLGPKVSNRQYAAEYALVRPNACGIRSR